MEIKVLDHGYVKFIEAWGRGEHSSRLNDDYAYIENDFEVGIIEAARQSTQGSFRGWEKDAKLLHYLFEHKHNTPFEFSGMVIEVQAPIFVFREWHRHRTQSYNEMSARYEPLPNLCYVPDSAHVFERAQRQTSNKQASGTGAVLSEQEALFFENDVRRVYRDAEDAYQNALASGVPKELARIMMPVGHYSRMRASANLRNWLAFLTLRTAPNAQWEIRQFAGAIEVILSKEFPRTASLFRSIREPA